jgi:hypothetical protein
MELTSQLANLEDEIKLVKGEIKSILKEIRAAVLNSDNPFSNPTALKQVAPAAPPVDPDAPEEATPFVPRPVDVGNGAAAVSQPVPVGDSPFAEPVQLRAEAHDAVPERPRTSLLTIAALLAWSEDAIAVMGARRFRFMLELAFFADLLSPEIRDVLRDAADAWSKDSDSDQPVSVNECVLQLRQLEAIANGERVERIPRRRPKRRSA